MMRWTPAPRRLAVGLTCHGYLLKPDRPHMKTILLAEDDEQLARSCAEILRRAGYTVITVDDGDAAVTTFAASSVDLLVVDMFLPGKDGFEIIDACKQIRPDVPIIGISGGGGVTAPDSLLRDARELGALVTITKPFSQSDLLSVVNHILHPGPKPPGRWRMLNLIRRSKGK